MYIKIKKIQGKSLGQIRGMHQPAEILHTSSRWVQWLMLLKATPRRTYENVKTRQMKCCWYGTACAVRSTICNCEFLNNLSLNKRIHLSSGSRSQWDWRYCFKRTSGHVHKLETSTLKFWSVDLNEVVTFMLRFSLMKDGGSIIDVSRTKCTQIFFSTLHQLHVFVASLKAQDWDIVLKILRHRRRQMDI